jgi:hypothetical protein
LLLKDLTATKIYNYSVIDYTDGFTPPISFSATHARAFDICIILKKLLVVGSLLELLEGKKL